MSNVHHDPRSNQWNAPQRPAGQPQPSSSNRFFAWIRKSQLKRGRDRWVGGVCDGLARRLGWNVALVRALVILTSLFFGCGAAFYGMAWFLLPDETDDRILCEELIAGHWDWSCIGVFVCMAIAICLPGAGWVAFAVAALILWLIVNRQTYAPAWQQQAQYGPVPHNPYVLGAQGAAGPMPPQAPPFVATMDGPKPVSPWYQRGMPQQQGVPPYDSVYRQGPAGGTGDVPPQAHVSQQPMNGPAAFATANVPPTFTAPAAPIEPQPRYGRRKPAGPFLVLMTFGLALLAVAGLYWYDTFDGSKTSQNIIADKLQVTTLVAGGFCLLMGVIIIILGSMGRRAGGLHPLTWLAATMAVIMVICTGTYSICWYRFKQNDTYQTVALAGTKVMGSSAAQMKRYGNGIAVVGNDYDSDILHIDLSQYGKNNGSHKVRLNDGTMGDSTCPTGTINMTVSSAQVVVTIPDGCWWTLGGYEDEDYDEYSVLDHIGGPSEINMMDAGGAIDGTLSFGSDYRSDAMAGQRAFDTTDRDTGCRFMHPDDSTDSDDSDDSADATSGQRFDSPFKDADADRSFGGIVKTGNQRGKRGFAGSGWSDECGHRACGDIQTDVVKRRGGAVGVGHMVDGHVVAVRMFRLRRLGERRYAQIPFDAQCRSAGELIAPLHIADRGDGGWQHHGGQRGGQHLRRGHIAGLYQQHADGEINRGKQGGGDECLGDRTPTNERPAPIVVLFDEVVGGALVLPQ